MIKMYPFIISILIFISGPVSGDPGTSALKRGETARITQVIDGDTVVLDNGRQVRMVGIQAPKLPLGRRGFEKWPLADQAKATLEEIGLKQNVELRYGGARMDRHGRQLAHLFLEDGTWLQGEMLKRGLARVYTFPDNRKVASEMYTLEKVARYQGQGLWAHPFYAVLSPLEAAKHIGTFQLVAGKIISAAKVKGRVYLNFGADWRKDFTIAIHSKAVKIFKKTGIDPLFYEGKNVRVRGWLKSYNGPMIQASHPEQIEILSPIASQNK